MKMIIVMLFVLFGMALGQQGCSLSLDGSGSKLVFDRFVNGFPSGIPMEQGTLEAWIKPTKSVNFTATTGVILQTGTIWATIPQSYVFSYDYARKNIKLDVYSNNDDEWTLLSMESDGDVHLNVWTHVAVTLPDIATPANIKSSSSPSMKLYVNGKTVNMKVSKQSSTDSEMARPCHRFSVGANFSGLIDEVHVWSVVRTKDDIVNSMKHKTCSTADLVLYLSFDECEGNVTLDHSANAACGRMRAPSPWDKYKTHGGNFSRHHGGGHHHGFSGLTAADGRHPAPFWLVGDKNATTPAWSKKHHGGGGGYAGGEGEGKHNFERKSGDGKHHRGDFKFGEHKFDSTKNLTFGAPAPAVGYCMESFAVMVNATEQCPYSTLHKQPHHPDCFDCGGVDPTSDDFVGNFLWNVVLPTVLVFAFLIGVVRCIRCCRKTSHVAATYQEVPVEEEPQPSAHFDGYPGAYPINLTPEEAQFDENVAAQQAQQPFPQPMFVYPPNMGMFDPRMAPSYMYYMPQPVFYAPNLEHPTEDEQ